METMRLGGNIELNGFSEFDGGTMVILKKIIGNHTKNLFSICRKFEKLSLTIDVPREVEKSNSKNLYELKGLVVDDGKEFNFETQANNLFFAVDDVLKNLEKNFQEYKQDLVDA